ncbi:hypothetical protein XELAEV_18041793mg [Xenopus laevis]|uniref:Uncharacterized protein n=1 Tax=Xenopus laevis TaxID=8355 RepID=A0A974H5R8_XENLA|nr:hypothetical protein XELAEV_18041793mg [Xenopus laevis]
MFVSFNRKSWPLSRHNPFFFFLTPHTDLVSDVFSDVQTPVTIPLHSFELPVLNGLPHGGNRLVFII